MNKIIEIIDYCFSFPKDNFQGKISYHKIPVDTLIYDLFGYLTLYLFLSHKNSNEYINIEKFNEDFKNAFENVELSEQGMVDMYLCINEQKRYIRNVKLITFIIFKENWSDIEAYMKLLKVKNKVLYLKKLIKIKQNK